MSILQYYPKLLDSVKYDSNFASGLHFWKVVCINNFSLDVSYFLALSPIQMLLCRSYLFGKQSDSFEKFLKAFVVGIRSKILPVPE